MTTYLILYAILMAVTYGILEWCIVESGKTWADMAKERDTSMGVVAFTVILLVGLWPVTWLYFIFMPKESV